MPDLSQELAPEQLRTKMDRVGRASRFSVHGIAPCPVESLGIPGAMAESRINRMTAVSKQWRTATARLVPLLLVWAVLGSVIASPLEAQTCLGFSGAGFLGASGAIRREGSDTTTGFGGSAGLGIGRVAAVASYLRVSGTDEFEPDSGFQNIRAAVAYEAITSTLSLCPVLTVGTEGVSSRDFPQIPYRAEPFVGGGLALGRRFTAPDSGLGFIPSLIVATESHKVERVIEGDILTRSRETVVLLRGGVTVEFSRLFVRPYLALIAVDNGWLTGGVRFGLTF